MSRPSPPLGPHFVFGRGRGGALEPPANPRTANPGQGATDPQAGGGRSARELPLYILVPHDPLIFVGLQSVLGLSKLGLETVNGGIIRLQSALGVFELGLETFDHFHLL